jgi:hypothetical protein
MDEQTLKLKRQVRDHYNKVVSDRSTIIAVAKIINYQQKENEK